ncbi:MAG: hypothetical protein LBF93_04345 [Zoogloeaceae bacterium]|jgi:hypothetical protein|nr:hypothetical protein [Zoogloeaceae bacterium]
MAARKTPAPAPEPATPSVEVPPPYTGHHDHSFTLQAIMELKGSMGKIESAIEANTRAIEKLDVRQERDMGRLEAKIGQRIEKVDARIDAIEKNLSGVTHKIYAAGVVLFIVLSVGAFFVNKAWDMVAARAAETVTAPAKQ